MSKPIRIQSAYISETEVKKVVKYLADNYRNEIPAEIDLNSANKDAGNTLFSAMLDEGDLGDEDDMYEQAKEEVIKAGKASTSYIQRKLRVGYARAARIMDMLEDRGVIGPADGAKPREVIGLGMSDQSSTENEDIDSDSIEDSGEGENNKDLL
jgi:S-DNA-T family DNA segregation ATPase FtsK/SpoIIIE